MSDVRARAIEDLEARKRRIEEELKRTREMVATEGDTVVSSVLGLLVDLREAFARLLVVACCVAMFGGFQTLVGVDFLEHPEALWKDASWGTVLLAGLVVSVTNTAANLVRRHVSCEEQHIPPLTDNKKEKHSHKCDRITLANVVVAYVWMAIQQPSADTLYYMWLLMQTANGVSIGHAFFHAWRTYQTEKRKTDELAAAFAAGGVPVEGPPAAAAEEGDKQE